MGQLIQKTWSRLISATSANCTGSEIGGEVNSKQRCMMNTMTAFIEGMPEAELHIYIEGALEFCQCS
jgi:hypothetical protein